MKLLYREASTLIFLLLGWEFLEDRDLYSHLCNLLYCIAVSHTRCSLCAEWIIAPTHIFFSPPFISPTLPSLTDICSCWSHHLQPPCSYHHLPKLKPIFEALFRAHFLPEIFTDLMLFERPWNFRLRITHPDVWCVYVLFAKFLCPPLNPHHGFPLSRSQL